MKNSYLLTLIGIVALTVGMPSAQATCACMCLEGSEQTVCDNLAEASADQNLCVDAQTVHGECPTPQGSIDPAVDATTPAGTENCVRARVYDPATDEYLAVNVCDLAS